MPRKLSAQEFADEIEKALNDGRAQNLFYSANDEVGTFIRMVEFNGITYLQ